MTRLSAIFYVAQIKSDADYIPDSGVIRQYITQIWPGLMLIHINGKFGYLL
jgi:hypothetical protein